VNDTATLPTIDAAEAAAAADTPRAPLAGGSASLAPDAPEADAAEPGRVARTWGGMRQIIGWVVLGIAIVLLWPAQLGGLTGLTVVNGHSMEPTYVTDDLIVSMRQPHYHVGDIVSYEVPAGQNGAGGRVIHRIVSVQTVDGAMVYGTRGDNNPQADPWVIGDADVLGRAVLRLPGVGIALTPDGAPIVLAVALGAVVTLLLWGGDARSRSRSRDAADAS